MEETFSNPASTVNNKTILQKLGNLYFEPFSVERWNQGRIYELLGIKPFKKLVLKFGDIVGMGRHNVYKRAVYQLNSKKKLARIECNTILSEIIHGPFGVYCLYSTIEDIAQENYTHAATIGTIGLVNIYLSMLQRYNRVRVQSLSQKMKE